MTREEKEHIGKYILEMAKLLEDGCYQQEILLGAVRIIDEALEQEPTNSVLKNIKAEISDELVRMYMYRNYANGLGKAIELIDKYMTESEPQKSEDKE